MTYDQSRTEPTKVVGDLTLRTFRLDITNYDDDSGGDGESFTPDDANGMHRFVHVHADVVGGSPHVANYDEDNQAIRLYDLDGTGEVASDGNNTATLRVTVLGV